MLRYGQQLRHFEVHFELYLLYTLLVALRYTRAIAVELHIDYNLITIDFHLIVIYTLAVGINSAMCFYLIKVECFEMFYTFEMSPSM